jgi:hypothetical protein
MAFAAQLGTRPVAQGGEKDRVCKCSGNGAHGGEVANDRQLHGRAVDERVRDAAHESTAQGTAGADDEQVDPE